MWLTVKVLAIMAAVGGALWLLMKLSEVIARRQMSHSRGIEQRGTAPVGTGLISLFAMIIIPKPDGKAPR